MNVSMERSYEIAKKREMSTTPAPVVVPSTCVAGAYCDASSRKHERRHGGSLSLAVVRRDGACVRCGGSFMLSAHHVIPRAEGGPDALGNLKTLCVACYGRASAEERRY